MIVEKIKNSYIGYNENHDLHIREYYIYCVSLFKTWLLSQDLNLNIIFGDYKIDFPNTNFPKSNKTIRLDIQCEHILVKTGGRSVNELIYGTVKSDDGHYLIRIDDYDYFNSLDIIIDYSLANLFNVSTNSKFNEYLSKTIYIAPTLYDLDFSNRNKTDIITLFTKTGNVRRINILSQLETLGVSNKIIDSCFTKECLIDQYSKTKIMVNVHQTDHHHTFEELRVLPALLNGVIIISEESPLTNVIPYSDYIIWVKYEDIAAKTLEVANNYSQYYNQLFSDGKLEKILIKMMEDNVKSINNLKI